VVAYGNGRWVAIYSSYSDSGIGLFTPAWYQVTNTAFRPVSISYANSQFFVTGNRGRISRCQHDSVSVASAWTTLSLPTTASLGSVVYGNGLYVVVGDSGKILTSPDLINWTIQTSGTTFFLISVAYGNSQFVAVGYSAVVSSGVILHSSDGINWALDSSGTSEGLYSVTTNGNGQFVAVGNNGTIIFSSSGTGIKSYLISTDVHAALKVLTHNSLLTISLPSSMLGRKVDVSVYSASGRVVLKKRIARSSELLTVPVPNLATGAYVLSVNDGLQKKAVRFVVTR
jgi:hypothetical protein